MVTYCQAWSRGSCLRWRRAPDTLRGLEEVVYKICPESAWLEAQRRGELVPSADDRRDGYMHLSAKAQLVETLRKHFADQRDLVLLSILTAGIPSEALRWEPSRGGQLFPHLYAELPVSLVHRADSIPYDEHGRHALPELVDDTLADSCGKLDAG